MVKVAEAEADRVEREMYYVAKQLWAKLFPGKALPPDDAEGRRATIADRARRTRQGSRQAGNARRRCAQDRGQDQDVHPRQEDPDAARPGPCKIIEMPEFQRGFSVAYLNPAPPLDPKADSLYAVARRRRTGAPSAAGDLLPRIQPAMLQILTIHEAYPGHYVQLEYSNRCPSLIRKVLWSGSFAEGWAVYTEQMMLDQGYGDGDLSLRLHQLKFYLRAVLNAILDHKMHCANMTDDEAMKLLVERGFQTEAEAVGKIARAKQSSTQLSTYFVGRTAFYRLRQDVQRKQGDAFDLGEYPRGGAEPRHAAGEVPAGAGEVMETRSTCPTSR